MIDTTSVDLLSLIGADVTCPLQLENVASLLSHHSNVDPDAVVDTINDMIDQASLRVFHMRLA